MLYKKGLAYRAEALVNYDPIDKTVLANEQVDSNGRSWRSGALVQQVNLRQWFFRIKAFQEELLKDLDYLSQNSKWPERVLTQQRNWLGRSQGARIQFELQQQGQSTPVHVFTTRPDTLCGVTYIALALSHPVVTELAASIPELQMFINKKASFTPESKDGFELPIQARHPISTDSEATIPVFVAPYVLEDYGEGAVMGVPAHDARDLAFWKLHRPNSAIPLVVQPPDSGEIPTHILPNDIDDAFDGQGTLTDLCNQYAGMSSKQAGEQIVADLAADGRAEMQETWRLRDWLVSRQRYWGTPIPIIHCDSCGIVPVPDEDLPVTLPKLPDSFHSQRGNPLDKISEWVKCSCPKCHQPARRETDTMDTFVDSSWYYARFPDPQNERELFSKDVAKTMLPVDTYVGGVEHAILHLLYARFIYKFLCSEGLVPSHGTEQEPFQQLIAQGMVHGKTFSDPKTGRFLLPHEVDSSSQGPVITGTGIAPNVSWEKMSKSKYNGVDPSTCIEKYGADATRAHVLFSAPVSEILQWDEQALVGIQRWFGRVQELTKTLQRLPLRDIPTHDHQITSEVVDQSSGVEVDLLLLAQDTIRNVTRKFDNIYGLNTTISDLMKLTNALHEAEKPALQVESAVTIFSVLLRMLAPIAPAFAEQCWEDMSLHKEKDQEISIFDFSWPTQILDSEAEATLRATRKSMVCAVQVNGKLRFTTKVPALVPGEVVKAKLEREQEIINAVLATDMGRLWLEEKNDWEKRKRVVVAKEGKLLNVVF